MQIKSTSPSEWNHIWIMSGCELMSGWIMSGSGSFKFQGCLWTQDDVESGQHAEVPTRPVTTTSTVQNHVKFEVSEL